jgi:hypothetical protein
MGVLCICSGNGKINSLPGRRPGGASRAVGMAVQSVTVVNS